MLNFLKKMKLNDFNVVFDVGAHKGETIDLYLKHFNIEKLYSFEPNYFTFNYLKKKIDKIKNIKNKTEITIENIALGKENKQIMMKHLDESSSSTIKEINTDSNYFKRKKKLLLNLKNKNFFSEISAQQICLDEYMSKKNISKIDFLKIDTEGYEFEVLSGAKNNIKNVNLVLFEHHYHDMIKKNYKFSNLHDLLNKNNFEQIYKAKMPFRKTFEYIYRNKTY
ncbi:FkbM family methyltransferase [Candidatus Pelagibacter sp.]|nr:FkbM family methyltransferase [Candidatus Pelagibacter sp.]